MSESSKSEVPLARPGLHPQEVEDAAPIRTPGRTPEFIVSPGEIPIEDGPLLEPQLGAPGSQGAPSVEIFSRAATAIARVGQDWADSEEILGRWLEEARGIGKSLEDDLARGDIQALGSDVRRMQEILTWIDSARAQALRQADFARRAFEVRDTAALVRDAAQKVHVEYSDIDIQLPRLNARHRSYCRSTALGQAFELALRAVARRIGGAGTIRIEIELGPVFLMHHVRATPDAKADRATQLPGHWVERLRHLVVDVHHGRLLPGGEGVEGSSLTIAIPRLDQS